MFFCFMYVISIITHLLRHQYESPYLSFTIASRDLPLVSGQPTTPTTNDMSSKAIMQ